MPSTTNNSGQRPAVHDGPSGSYMYRSIHGLLAGKIATNELPAGAIIKEGSIATHLGVSRAPVRRALAMLQQEGTIHAAEGQGYIVGTGQPLHLSSRRLNEILGIGGEDIGRSASWERIFKDVSDEVMASMPFGTYRIQEAELGSYHHVSRTVAREVLWRLMDHRLIEKNRKSHWIVGQLTARDIRESLEMRQLLEPQALSHVAATLDATWLDQIGARIDAALTHFPECDASSIDTIERDMFRTMYAGLRNARLLSSIRRNKISLIVSRLFRQHFPIRDDRASLVAYSQIVQHLRTGDVEVARLILRRHLAAVEPLTLARLRVLSVLPPPRRMPYLTAIHEPAT